MLGNWKTGEDGDLMTLGFKIHRQADWETGKL